MIETVEITSVESTDNEFKVQKKQWTKWSALARRVFNEVYSSMLDSQEAFTHPKMQAQAHEHWQTVAWNAAWIAACATNRGE